MRINNAEDPVKVIETAYENGIDFLTMQIFMGTVNVKKSLQML